MQLAKVISLSHAKFHCNKLTTVLDYMSLIFGTHCIIPNTLITLSHAHPSCNYDNVSLDLYLATTDYTVVD